MAHSNFNPKVSIVIPVYNGSNYLKEAIDSALDQKYKNIEVIVVNDGSNDDGATESIAKSYGNKIKYYKKKNGGVATALNLGIEKMTGEYFSWLSHDDLYYPNKISRQIKYLGKLADKNIVLYSNHAILKGNKTYSIIYDHQMLKSKKEYSLLRGCINGITLLIPKIILDETGGFDQHLRCTQDYDYWFRIQKKFNFVHMKDILSISRIHPSQGSNISPSALAECNTLWIRMIGSINDVDKMRLEGSVYGYYTEMANYLKGTPYNKALEFCNEKIATLKPDRKDMFCKIKTITRDNIAFRIVQRLRNQSLIGIMKSIINRVSRAITK